MTTQQPRPRPRRERPDHEPRVLVDHTDPDDIVGLGATDEETVRRVLAGLDRAADPRLL